MRARSFYHRQISIGVKRFWRDFRLCGHSSFRVDLIGLGGNNECMEDLPAKVVKQIAKAGLPTGGTNPFEPRLATNAKGELTIEKQAPSKGPKSGKKGYVDQEGRIWIKDAAHAGLPVHWDVQIEDGDDYIRVDFDGEELQKS